jgi:hypothetical protein
MDLEIALLETSQTSQEGSRGSSDNGRRRRWTNRKQQSFPPARHGETQSTMRDETQGYVTLCHFPLFC